ncbi:methionyl-tRNA formyltransferase [Iamia sp. SCSIO 61187]|uniref:methionyl-tRNA formyltransferase n=1 Tax=Iamia sp. SCSIO 61187 TaxID=2722752 RepID=UPI001C6318C3|nr:methionyl-tRNA formyltransferase [Iamia sp. SCSIO 61187]QYG93078.1 methionyl-tRNA formyltransferase [Iamia sp. SCSIO 61187]
MSAPPAVPPRHPRRLVFLGTPAASVPALRALVAAGFDIVLVISQPDRRRGRGGATSPSPVKAAALELGLAVTDRVEDAAAAGADLGVVVAYGEILRADLLAALPMVNIHFSLLPRWRGAAPVERALLAGDETTGVCIMEVVEALDAGGVHAVAEIPIGPDATAAELREELSEVGARLLVETLTAGLGEPTPQDGEPTYAKKIRPGDLFLDWSRPAAELHRVVRVGGAWTTFRGARLRVWEAHVDRAASGAEPGAVRLVDGAVVVAAGDGHLVLDEVQPEGRGRVLGPAWANGARLADDEVLGA